MRGCLASEMDVTASFVESIDFKRQVGVSGCGCSVIGFV